MKGFPVHDFNNLLDARQMPAEAVFLLQIDNAHHVVGHDDAVGSRNSLLASLHENTMKLPVMSAFYGLSHTPDVLLQSISRRWESKNKILMRCFAEDETHAYGDAITDHLGLSITPKDRKNLLDWMHRECHGFPQHLRGVMSSIAERMIIDNSIDWSDLNRESIAIAIEDARGSYYEERLGMNLADYDAILDKWLDALETHQPTRRSRAKELLYDVLSTDDAYTNHQADDAEDLFGSTMSACRNIFDQALRSGVVYGSRKHPWNVPVPSLKTYIAKKGYAPRASIPKPSRNRSLSL